MLLLLQRRLSRLQHEFELQGAPPILWVKRTKGQGHGRLSIHQVFTDNPITFRWASGFSRKVPEADADIAAEAVIVDMSPVDPRHQKAVETYENCVCPVTLLNPNPWLRLWHGMVQLVAVLWIPFLSIRHSFSLTRTLDYHWIRIADMFFDPIISLLFAVDVVVQILTAVPSSGNQILNSSRTLLWQRAKNNNYCRSLLQVSGRLESIAGKAGLLY